MSDMRPITIVLIAAALAVAVGNFTLAWYTQVSGPNKVSLRPGKITVCQGETCTTQESDNADYDSMFLGITNAGQIAAGLGIIACGGAAAMAHGRKTKLGSGGTAITSKHLMFAALIGLGLTLASFLMMPMGLVKAPGIFVALAGYAVGAGAIATLKDETPRPPPMMPRPVG